MPLLTDYINFFTQLAFPIAVAAWLLISTTRQLERVRINQLKMLVMLGLCMRSLGISVADNDIDQAVEMLIAKEKKDE